MCRGRHIAYTPGSPWYSRKYDRLRIDTRFIQLFTEFLCGFFLTDNARGDWCFTMTDIKAQLFQARFPVISIFPQLLIQFSTFHKHFNRFFTGNRIRWRNRRRDYKWARTDFQPVDEIPFPSDISTDDTDGFG